MDKIHKIKLIFYITYHLSQITMSNLIYKDNGDLLVFGYNDDGQLGLGYNNSVNIPILLITDKI